MSKQIPILLQDQYDGYAATTCMLVRIRRTDGQKYGLTDLDVPIDYNAAPAGPGMPGDDFGMMTHVADNGGVSISKTEAAADLGVTNAELTVVPSDAITPEDALAGKFTAAEVYIYRVNFMDLSAGHELVDFGYGDVSQIVGNQVVIAFRSMSDLLKEPQVVQWSKTCDHEFGGPFCPKTLVWTTGTVTGVDTDEPARLIGTSVSAADEFYTGGVIHVLSGANIGREMEIDQSTGGTLQLAIDLDRPFQIGDQIKVRQHCNKVYDDASHGCLYHWGVVDRNKYFGGCPDIPTGDGGSSMIPGNGLSSDD